MARGRMLNKKVSRSLQFDQLPDDTCRLLATWTIAHLDVNGVFCADPGVVRSLVFTRRTDISIEQIESYLQAMEDVGLIVRFKAKGDIWQHWPEFRENQAGLRTDRETAEYPLPPYAIPEPFQQDDGNYSADIRQDDGNCPAEVKLSEVEIKVKSSEENTNGADAGAGAPPANLDGWQSYIQVSKNRPAALLLMHDTLFPGRDPPDFGYIGRTAKTVGGAGRLAVLLWQAVAFKPDGDVMRYCMGMAKNKGSPAKETTHEKNLRILGLGANTDDFT